VLAGGFAPVLGILLADLIAQETHLFSYAKDR
jgi:hypothetical protein